MPAPKTLSIEEMLQWWHSKKPANLTPLELEVSGSSDKASNQLHAALQQRWGVPLLFPSADLPPLE